LEGWAIVAWLVSPRRGRRCNGGREGSIDIYTNPVVPSGCCGRQGGIKEITMKKIRKILGNMKKKLRFTIFKGFDEQWYCHVRHKNGNIVLDLSEGYTRKGSLKRNLNNIIKAIKEDNFEIVEGTMED